MANEYLILLSVLVWSGCIIAISFMESWLKFRAPGVTLPIGLGIGKMVFNVLNKMEWLFASVMMISYIFYTPKLDTSIIVLSGTAVLMLIIQTAWLLPTLDTRANAVISGKSVATSLLHWYFIVAEVIKLASLLILGFRLFRTFTGQ